MVTTKKTARTAKRATKTTRSTTTPTAAKKSGVLGDLGRLVDKFKIPGIDVAAIVEAQRKDMEALAEANRQAYEGIKALAQRRNEILQESLVEWQAAMKEAGGKDALARGAAQAKKGVQQAIANFKELADMEAQTRSKAWKVVQDRFQENLANLQKLLQPK
jgi:phasin family protein